jgi:cytochrome c oxidase cbb3-type subunit 3
MFLRNWLFASAAAAFAAALTPHLGAQGAPQAPAPPQGQTQAPAPPQGQTQAPAPAGRQGRGNEPAVFPAQQRPPGDPAVIERGKGLYVINCSACHGQDLRGGGMGGPNLLRSQVVLSDQHGELILPIVHGARAERGMPALPLPDTDVTAIAEYIHSVLATAQRQGAPPPSANPPPNAIVGDASAGEVYFRANCAQCHSASGDLQGIGTRLSEGKALQNFWVTGGGGRGRGRGGPEGSGSRDSKAVIATITLPGGQKVQGPLVRLDNFLVTISLPDGTERTFRRAGDQPADTLDDPMAAHKALPGQLTDKDMHDVTAYLSTLK